MDGGSGSGSLEKALASSAQGARSPATLARPAALVGIGLGVFFGALRSVNAAPAERSAEWFGEIAMGFAYATPSILALVALRSRRILLVAAALLSSVLAFTAFSGVSLALLVPAVSFLVAYGRGSAEADGPRARRALAVPITLVLGIAAFLVLFVHEDPLCWSEGCTSDTINGMEALASVALAASCVGVGAWLSRPGPVPSVPADRP